MNYTEWNNAIATHFFNAERGGEEVLLFVNEEKIDAIGSTQNSFVADFIGAIKKDAESTKGDICKRALDLYEDWRKTGSKYPPYIAYLALFVLASTQEGDFDPKAYYPRYWKLIEEPDDGTPTGFYETADLWEDLEKWSVEDKNEELGRFKSRIRGKWRHVGRPLSQTLLSDEERKALPGIFFDCGFDPTNIPSENIVKNGLLHYGPGRLRNRTLALLRSKDETNQDFINALLDFIINQLENWGRNESKTPIVEHLPKNRKLENKERENPIPSLFFRTCIEIDYPKQNAKISLRLKTTRTYPDAGLEFEVNGKTLLCCETIPAGWSRELLEIPSKVTFDPSQLNWLEDWHFIDSENGWNASYKKSNVRLFVPGDQDGISGFVESQKLLRDCKFIIVCHNSIAPTIEKWGQISCKNFSKLPYSGIPKGWTLFAGKEPTASCPGIDVLGLSNLARLQLDGGIMIGHPHLYLCYAPPRIKIDGGFGNEKLLLNGTELKKNPEKVCWELPDAVPINRPLNLQIIRDEVLQESRIIQLVEPSINIQIISLTLKRDSKGDLIEHDSENYVWGALNTNLSVSNMSPLELLKVPLFGSSIFVGQIVGQISRQPDFEPVWVITKVSRKEWTVTFCRSNITEDLEPKLDKKYRLQDLKSWKETLWFMRKRTHSPELITLCKLWNSYVEAAKNI
jgi:hypothetical protein